MLDNSTVLEFQPGNYPDIRHRANTRKVKAPRKYTCNTCLKQVEKIFSHGKKCRAKEKRIEIAHKKIARLMGVPFYSIRETSPALARSIHTHARDVTAHELYLLVKRDYGSVAKEHLSRSLSAMVKRGLIEHNERTGTYRRIKLPPTEAQRQIEASRNDLQMQLERYKTCQDRASLEALTLLTAELVLGFLQTADEIAATLGVEA